ncbi:MgtC/SapB family protein [Roseibacterium sp. SDUM158017]|uniref:MgtC/SapB family protein n=1 Tax=Roseicyclus salinarum TaxID=3036773 RepID=UPI002414FE97|nr:MgtC/SapB family protein [Roseibacterium sp. SDUM158017]MDG4650506.1 MgtC/SapB family protein [Roseibacterium sp. SDUM158017]
MQAILDDILVLTALPWQVALTRLFGALVLSGLVGLEREARHRPAGLRTHMLVGLASALYCLIMLEVVATTDVYSDRVASDPLRLIEAVTGGVAFLAAGMIIVSGGKVKGLTTGAGLWLVAAIGLSVGFGYWLLAGATTVLALLVFRMIKLAENKAHFGGGD